MKKRSVMALVAGALLTAMLPGMAAAQGSTSTDVTSLATLTRDYVWDGRLAGNLTNDYVWDGRLAGNLTNIYVWDRRLAGSPSLALVLVNQPRSQSLTQPASSGGRQLQASP